MGIISRLLCALVVQSNPPPPVESLMKRFEAVVRPSGANSWSQREASFNDVKLIDL